VARLIKLKNAGQIRYTFDAGVKKKYVVEIKISRTNRLAVLLNHAVQERHKQSNIGFI
jgi:hypothetical protein